MKLIHITLVLIVFQLIFIPATFAKESFEPWSFSVDLGFSYSPKTEPISGETHFAPVTGAFGSAGAMASFNASYTLPTPLGENPLVSNSNVTFAASLALTPITLSPSVSVSFSPVAFLQFAAGSSAGFGWDMSSFDVQGLAYWDKTEYVSDSAFKDVYYNFWVQGTFQFDLAAVFPGEWNHFVTVVSYKLMHESASCGKEANPYVYQGSSEKFKGVSYSSSIMLGYQMPFVLQTVGIMAQFTGMLNNTKIASEFEQFKVDFMSVSVGPVVGLCLSDNDNLNVICQFSSRRSFYQEYEKSYEQLFLEYAGSEWFFNNIAISYSHKF